MEGKGTGDLRNDGDDIYEPETVLWFDYTEEVVCNRDGFILNALFDFKPMKGLEYWGDVKMF